MKYLVGSLNEIVGQNEMEFTETIIRNAFCHSQCDSLVQCADVTGDDNIDGILHIRWGRQGSHRKSVSLDQEYVYDLRLFRNMALAKDGQKNAANTRVMTDTMITEVSPDVVPNELKEGLIEFLEDERREKNKADAKAEKKRAAMETALAQSEKKRRQSVDIEEERDQLGQDVIQSLRAQVDKIRLRRNEIQAELDIIDNNLEVARAKLSDAIGSASDEMYDYSFDRNTNSSLGERNCLQYYYNGRSGVLHLVGNNQILVEADFTKGFLPLVKTASPSKDLPLAIMKTYHIGQMQYFVPSSHKMSVLNREKAREDSKEIVSNILTRFNKKKSTWDERTKGILLL